MPQADILNEASGGWIDKRKVNGSLNNPDTSATTANYASIANLNSRLQTLNAGYFTTARLETMTENDKIYALRQLDDAASF